MKFLIAFILLIFSHCLAPTTILATVNVKTAAVHAHISPAKKLTFKHKLEEAKRKNDFIILGIVLILIGLLVISIGRNEPLPPPKAQFDLTPSISGRDVTIIIGNLICATGVGMVVVKACKFLMKKIFK
jgi:hypothetical protein